LLPKIRKLLLISLAVVSGNSLSIAQTTATSKQNGHRTDDKPIYFKADAREVIQPGTQPSDKVSATSIGNALTVLFDGAKINAQTESDPLSSTWATTIEIPINATGQHPTSYLQHIRGAVVKSETSRVCLVLSLGGRTFVKEYPYGMKSSGEVLLKFISPIRPRPATRYTATIVIIVERRDPKAAVLVNVDSLDVIARGPKPK